MPALQRHTGVIPEQVRPGHSAGAQGSALRKVSVLHRMHGCAAQNATVPESTAVSLRIHNNPVHAPYAMPSLWQRAVFIETPQ